MTELLNTKDYITFLNDIKKDIQTSRVRAALSVNKELILLYWRIGNSILAKQKEQGWGAKVVEQLSFDLKQAFPEMTGFSKQNLFYMRQFAGAYEDYQILQQLAGQIPVCQAWPKPWGCKSSIQPDGGEGLEKRKGTVVRLCLKEAWIKIASLRTETEYQAVLSRRVGRRPQSLYLSRDNAVNSEVVRGRGLVLPWEICIIVQQWTKSIARCFEDCAEVSRGHSTF
ncbi:MAG: hypothetical protein HEEMFOPI_01698 [Holosporales bacterium]